jgi:hypothetical protein
MQDSILLIIENWELMNMIRFLFITDFSKWTSDSDEDTLFELQMAWENSPVIWFHEVGRYVLPV